MTGPPILEAVALRHVPFEDLGLLEPLLRERGYRVSSIDVPTADLTALDVLAPDLLVVLGGPIGAYEVDSYPFLAREIALLEERLREARPVLGLCLGSQLMARALGARVYPGPRPEIGWGPLSLTEDGRRSCLRHLNGAAVLHWHGDTFDLPDGARRLASSEICENQAFTWERAALGLQFHAEACGPALERWFVGHAHEIAHTPDVTVSQLRADSERHSPILAPRGRRCFEDWLSELGL